MEPLGSRSSMHLTIIFVIKGWHWASRWGQEFTETLTLTLWCSADQRSIPQVTVLCWVVVRWWCGFEIKLLDFGLWIELGIFSVNECGFIIIFLFFFFGFWKCIAYWHWILIQWNYESQKGGFVDQYWLGFGFITCIIVNIIWLKLQLDYCVAKC